MYDLLMNQKAFVHWYLQEGMEQGDFAEAREDLAFLRKDYQDMLGENESSEYDSEWDESSEWNESSDDSHDHDNINCLNDRIDVWNDY